MTVWLLSMVLFHDWQIEETGIFEPLTRREVLLTPTGEIYILNFAEALIRRFAADGTLQNNIGRKGEGPGEFRYPVAMFFNKGQLYVHDVGNDAISVFTAEGSFIKRLRLPGSKTVPVKTLNGWVTGAWRAEFSPEATSEVVISDEAFSVQKALFKVRGRGQIGKFAVSGGLTEYTPVYPTPKMAVSPDGTTVAVSDAEIFKIHIIDVPSRSVVNIIEKTWLPVPFDGDWADIRLLEVKAMRPNQQYKVNYPEYFPAIRSLSFSPEGWLEIDRWVGAPHLNHHPIYLDREGREIKRKLTWAQVNRLVGYWENWAYILGYDSRRDEATVLRCPKDGLREFMQENPIEILEKTHRVINR